jgi:hypothetical protein
MHLSPPTFCRLIRFLSFDHRHRSCSHALIGRIAFLPPFLPPGKTVPGAVGLRAGSGSAFPDVKPSIMASHPSTRTPTPSLLVGGSTRSGTIWQRRLPSPPYYHQPSCLPRLLYYPLSSARPPSRLDWLLVGRAYPSLCAAAGTYSVAPCLEV